jgi:hypothetical protein
MGRRRGFLRKLRLPRAIRKFQPGRAARAVFDTGLLDFLPGASVLHTAEEFMGDPAKHVQKHVKRASRKVGKHTVKQVHKGGTAHHRAKARGGRRGGGPGLGSVIGGNLRDAVSTIGRTIGKGAGGDLGGAVEDIVRGSLGGHGGHAGGGGGGRRTNPGNIKALRRSIRRIKSAEKLFRQVFAFTHKSPAAHVHVKRGRRRTA